MKQENYKKRLLTYSVPKLKEVADGVASEFIRRVYANWKGETACYTCGVIKPWKQQQCGHYISRVYNNTRYYEPNLRPQCYRCNVLLKGNYPEFGAKLDREVPGTTQMLVKWKNRESTNNTRMDLIEIIETYKDKLKELQT